MNLLCVDTRIKVADTCLRPYGINVNYLRDADSNFPDCRPLSKALIEMGAAYLRYPGGEKSDFYLLARPIADNPAPQVHGSYCRFIEGYELLGFDAFMDVARQAGARPHLVVGYDSQARSGISLDQYLENAVEWVRYANIIKGYNVINWEIGNENWHNQTGEPEKIADIVKAFSQQMKQIDSRIRIGASGNTREWWQRFLPRVADNLDFLTVSSYSCWDWKHYAYYADHARVQLMEPAETALQAIEDFVPGHKERLKVVISEFNSMDYSEDGWVPDNNLGHALVVFEMLGQMMLNSRIEYGMLWTTRWIEEQNPDLLWYALDQRNELLPPGRTLAIWSQFLYDQLVEITRTDEIVTFASYDSRGERLNLFLLNKTMTAQEAKIQLNGSNYSSATTYRFQGKGPADKHPVWHYGENLQVQNQLIDRVTLPPVSLTVLQLT